MVDKQKAIELRLAGHTYKQIAEMINCSVDWCKRNLIDYKKPVTVKRQREKMTVQHCHYCGHKLSQMQSSKIAES